MKTHKQVNERLDKLRDLRRDETETLIKIATDKTSVADKPTAVEAIRQKLIEIETEEKTLLWFLSPGN